MVNEAGPPPAYARYSAGSERTIFSTDSSVVDPGISNLSRIRTGSSQYSTISSIHDAGQQTYANNATTRHYPIYPPPIPPSQTNVTQSYPPGPAVAPPIQSPPAPTTPVARTAGYADNPKNPAFDSLKGKEPSANWFDRLITDWWWWELLSWIVSGMAMGAIVIVLVMYDGQPIPRWRFGITLNAYVAVLAAISRAALILPVSEAIGQLKWLRVRQNVPLIEFHDMDNASRGPWGSFMLMIRSRLSHIAALGAAITILSLAVEPFFQQILDYPIRLVPTGAASVPYAESYFINIPYPMSNPLVGDRTMQAAIETAFYGENNEKPSMNPSCPTNDCTWPEYSSLAVCSRCQDVSSMLKYRCFYEEKVFTGTPYNGNTQVGCGWFLNSTYLVGSLQNSFGDKFVRSTSLVPVESYDNITRTPPDRLDPGRVNSTIFADTPNVIVDLYAATIPGGFQGALNNNTATLSNCILQWCVQTYRSNFSAGIFDEEVFGTFTNNTKQPNPADQLAAGLPSAVLIPHDSEIVYIASNSSTKAFKEKFLELLNAYADTKLPQGNNSTRDVRDNVFGDDNVTPGKVGLYIGRIAEVMTTIIRTRRSASKNAVGTAYSPQNFVQVRWYWISLPVAIYISSFLFLAATILKNSRGSVPAWKNSALATMIYGLDDLGASHMQLDRASDVEAKAEQRNVQLFFEDSFTRIRIVRSEKGQRT